MWKEDHLTFPFQQCYFNGNVEGWIPGGYGPSSTYGRKEFWQELYDLVDYARVFGVWPEISM